MAQWHLEELRAALEKRGWRITQEEGDGYRFSARWSLRRAGDTRALTIDFDGLDEQAVLPLPLSYGCTVAALGAQLHFSRRGEKSSESRRRWEARLGDFARALEAPALARNAA